MLSSSTKLKHLFLISSLSVMLAACGSDNSSNDTTPNSTANKVTISISGSDDLAVPTVSGTATATGSITLNKDTGALSGSITASGLSGAITAAHIHSGIAGVSGGIIVTLTPDTNNTNQMNVPDGTTLDASQMTDLLDANYYFNIHTAAHASGEVRAQITPSDYLIVRSELTGSLQVPAAVITSNSGVAYTTVNTDTRLLRANVRNTGLDDATALHIHSGFAGTNGGIIVGLTQDTSDQGFWEVPANTTLTADQLSQLQSGGTYFNVHTPANASGEVRGQIIPTGVQLDRVSLNGDNQVPTAVTSAGSATGYLTMNTTSGVFSANVITSGLSDATAAHIHSGFAGTNGGITQGLTQDTSDTTLWSASGTLDSTGISDFMSGKLYFNVHTTTNASGDVRGQIEADNIKVTRDSLSGAQEVPAVTTSATGVGYTTVNEEDGSIVANLRTSGISATAAHIHKGVTGANGGIALGLTQDSSDTDFWSATGTLDSDQLTAFQADGLYFNVHSAANAAGEIRAQINR